LKPKFTRRDANLSATTAPQSQVLADLTQRLLASPLYDIDADLFLTFDF
jgi:hypothetical protein